MDTHQQAWNEKIAAGIIEWLEKRRMEGSYAPDAEAANAKVLEFIKPGQVVFRCGSMTAGELGLWEAIEAVDGVEVLNPYQPGLEPAEGMALRRRGLAADVMVASSNAITLDGRLVNLDGMGNRVAAMTFGPAKVVLVVGMNKVAPDLESAMARVKHYAAPVNAARINCETPCTVNGLCADCRAPKRICNFWSIIEGSMVPGRLHVVLVGENLGY
ncbi:MAG: lactate utilization protein [Desulfarculaceae bacterium]|nr:lactate utilization protein [Desulfarculaceae bacterium]MCF8072470.1 lactate utilization protein [Desulfarculaceae bacterium]MCF8102931.1 lactate utilization protein [Desulfarculaceae bacterium]MCF8117466.1 lactate utilization protein [Desulfarculaceae bacterium]